MKVSETRPSLLSRDDVTLALNHVVVSVGFPAEERAGSFLADPALREEMEQAGVQGQPTVVLCEEVEAVSY